MPAHHLSHLDVLSKSEVSEASHGRRRRSTEVLKALSEIETNAPDAIAVVPSRRGLRTRDCQRRREQKMVTSESRGSAEAKSEPPSFSLGHHYDKLSCTYSHSRPA